MNDMEGNTREYAKIVVQNEATKQSHNQDSTRVIKKFQENVPVTERYTLSTSSTQQIRTQHGGRPHVSLLQPAADLVEVERQE